MISIDEWPYLPGPLKKELLALVTSSDDQTHSHEILYKPCLTNPNLMFALQKGLPREKNLKPKVFYKLETPKDSTTKCFKAVFTLPQIEADMYLGKEIIDYNWVRVENSEKSHVRLFLTLATDRYNLVYELPDPLITADSHLDTKPCSLIHIKKHAMSLDTSYTCTSSFGLVFSQPALPSLNLEHSFNDQFFTYNQNFKQVDSDETFGISSPLGKVHKNVIPAYYKEMINAVKGKSWLSDDKSNECGNIFMISKFQTEATDQVFIQFDNLVLKTDKQRASGIIEKFSSDFEDLFVLDFWDFINTRRRLIYSALLAEHDLSLLRSSITKVEDAWINIINAGSFNNDFNLFGVLLDLLVCGSVDDKKIQLLDKCFTPRSVKKLAISVASTYENSKKVSSLIMSLEALRLNAKCCLTFLESKQEFCSLIETDFHYDCQMLANKLESFFEDEQNKDEFNLGLLSKTLNMEASHHAKFLSWISDLSKHRFVINNSNVNDLLTDKMIYDYLKVEQGKHTNQTNKQEDNLKIVRLLSQTVEDMNLKKMTQIDNVEDLPLKLQALMNDYA